MEAKLNAQKIEHEKLGRAFKFSSGKTTTALSLLKDSQGHCFGSFLATWQELSTRSCRLLVRSRKKGLQSWTDCIRWSRKVKKSYEDF